MLSYLISPKIQISHIWFSYKEPDSFNPKSCSQFIDYHWKNISASVYVSVEKLNFHVVFIFCEIILSAILNDKLYNKCT